MREADSSPAQLTLLTPYWNEAEILPHFLAHARTLSQSRLPMPLQWIFIDSWSTDQGPRLIDAFLSEMAQGGKTPITFHHLRPEVPHPSGPSIGRALNFAVQSGDITAPWVQVLPADCALPFMTVVEILQQLPTTKALWFACDKQYQPGTPLLKLHASLQNAIRLGILGRAVWTNGMGVRTPCLKQAPFPEAGFMEDSLWCDQLCEQYGIPAHFPHIKVSARRYYPNRILRRIVTNAVVIFVYRTMRLIPIVPITRALPYLKRLYLALR